MLKRSSLFLAGLVCAALLCLPIAATAQDSVLSLAPQGGNAGMLLRITGPDGLVFEQEFAAGDHPTVLLADLAARGEVAADGSYNWELTLYPVISDSVRAQMRRARQSGDEQLLERLRASLPPEGQVESGTFRVQDGAIVREDLLEQQAEGQAVRGPRALAEGASGPISQAEADQVIADDLIVTRSVCVGFDCVNGEDFGFDTIRLKENSLRIKFEDTSVAPFPTTDWQLTANDSASGGANKFSIDDITAARTPFTIEAGSVNHSLYVDNGGRVGFGTSTPVLELHAVNGDTAALRLEQSAASGFAPYTWDIAGNETNFFIRDVTGASALPFKIRPGAASNSLVVSNNSFVGVGTVSPSQPLHVVRSDGNARLLVQENNGVASNRIMIQASNNNGNVQTSFIASAGQPGAGEWRQTFRPDSFLLDSQEDGANELSLDINGNLTVTGAVTPMSDRNAKENFAPVDSQEILDRVARMEITRWNYKADGEAVHHIGPVAQDFREAFGLGHDDRHIATVDADGVALAAIQALYRQLREKDAALEALEAQNEALARRLEALEARTP